MKPGAVPEDIVKAAQQHIRRPQRNRLIAKKAADDIRANRFACIYHAADEYFAELASGKGEKDRRKDFVRYIYEDLKWNAPTEVVHPQGYAYPVFRRTRGWLASERSPKISC